MDEGWAVGVSGAMDIVDPASEVMAAMAETLGRSAGSVFSSVAVFNGTREDKLFEYAESAPLPSATLIYRGSAFKQGNPPRRLDVSVVVVSEMGEAQPAAWELVEAVVAALDNTTPTESQDSHVFAKGDRALDTGGAASCAAVDFEVRCY